MEKEKIGLMLEEFCKGKETLTTIDDMVVVKVPLTKNFDLLYYNGYDGAKLNFQSKLECFGFYNKKTDVCYALNSYTFYGVEYLKEIRGMKNHIIAEALFKFNQWVNSISADVAYANSDIVDEYFVNHTCNDLARKAIIEGHTSETYTREYKLNEGELELDTLQTCMVTLDPTYVIEELVNSLKLKLEKNVYNFVYETYLVKDKIAEYETDPTDSLFTLREMRKNIDVDNMQTVGVTICKDGKTLSFKYPTDSIYYRIDDNWMSTYNIPAPERRQFEEMFGKHADFKPLDIIKITYGKKVLFEAKGENYEIN